MRALRNGAWSRPESYRSLVRKLKHLFAGASQQAIGLPVSPNSVAELAKKSWAGFSRCACKDLDRMVHDERSSPEKPFAAWELARVHAIGKRWDQALYYLDVVRNLNGDLFKSEQATLLYIEALSACGRAEEAEALARLRLDTGTYCPNYYFTLSNVIATRAGRQEAPIAADAMRLSLLNGLYKQGSLSEICLTEASRGFEFGNLMVEELHLSSLHRQEKISVLITVRNAEQLLAIAVSSILRQTWSNVEVIIVDDASVDGSWKVIENLAKKDSRIVPVRNATNMGPFQARNRAISLATGDFVATWDSHSWSHPQMLESLAWALISEPETKLTFAGSAYVSPDLKFTLQLQECGTQYLLRSYRPLLIRREDLQCLGRWDGVNAYADDEFVQRTIAVWGERAVRGVLPDVPISLRLEGSDFVSSIRQARCRLPNSVVRREYIRQAELWRRRILLPASNSGQAVPIDRISRKLPFPVPGSLVPKRWRAEHYNLVIISDLTLLGGTRRCNQGYIEAAIRLGMNIGLLHWPRYDLNFADDLAEEYRLLSYSENIDVLTADDQVHADLVIIHHPPIMACLPDATPSIDTMNLAILVNQLPQRFGEEDRPYYRRKDVEEQCARLFGVEPVWVPISPLVRRVLSESGFAPLAKEDWIPPVGEIVVGSGIAPSRAARRRMPVIGRHSRDHRTKWPEAVEDLRAAYCADSEIPVRFLGGASFARGVLNRWPKNWEELPFDSVPVKDFLDGLDFLVHFTHSAYIEEFGRNVMEAMAVGIPAIVPPHFEEVFGDAACYASPELVEDLIFTMWGNRSAYAEQVERGSDFVAKFASNERVARRLREAARGII